MEISKPLQGGLGDTMSSVQGHYNKVYINIMMKGITESFSFPVHEKVMFMDFSGGPVVKTPSFHCRRHGFNLWLGNSDLIGHTERPNK